MTSSSDIEQTQTTEAATQADFKAAAHDWSMLANTAWAACNSISWSQSRKALELPLLDADFVYCGLSRFKVALAVKEQVHRNPDHELTFDIGSGLGPSRVRELLNQIQDYAIPIGAQVEIENARQYLNRRSSTTANGLNRFFMAAKNDRPLYTLLHALPKHDLNNYIFNSLRTFITSVTEAEMLQRLLQGAWKANDMLGGEPVPEAIETRRQVLRRLDRQRPAPNRANANLCDALNAETVVHIFNGGLKRDGHRVLPVLISRTQPIIECDDMIAQNMYWEELDPDHGRPRAVTSYPYLYLANAVRQRTGQFNFNLARDTLESLFADARRIADFCRRHLSNIDGKDLAPQIDDLEIEWLRRKAREFRNDWDYLFVPYWRAGLHDHVALLNEVMTPDLQDSLKLNASIDSVRSGVLAVQRRLQAFRGPGSKERDFFAAIQEYDAMRNSGEVACLRTLLFYFTTGEVDGALLSKTMPTPEALKLESDTIPDWTKSPHEKRIWVHLPHGQRGALLAFDSWRYDGHADRWLRITWRHKSDLRSIWISAIRLLEARIQTLKQPGQMISWKFYSVAAIKSGESCTVQALRDDYQTLKDPTFIEISLGCSWTFFTDVTLLDQQELQAGIVLHASYWPLDVQGRKILTEMIRSSHEEPIDIVHWQYLIDKLSIFGSIS